MKIVLDNKEYELIFNKDECFNEELLEKRYTDFFENYDYIVGDFSYDMLRLKGFYENSDNDINSYKKLDNYLENKCSYGCKYFVLKKMK